MRILEETKLLGTKEHIPKKIKDSGLEWIYESVLMAYEDLAQVKFNRNMDPEEPICNIFLIQDILFEHTERGRNDFVQEEIKDNQDAPYYSEEELENFMEELNEIWDENTSYSYPFIENDVLETIYGGNLCALQGLYELEDLETAQILNTPQVSVLTPEREIDTVFVSDDALYNSGVYF